jgi:hypothetical protein
MVYNHICSAAHENTYVQQLFIIVYVVRLMKILTGMYGNCLYM